MTGTAQRARRLAVTGTDTGIGKTVVTAALASRARLLGLSVAAMKPVESGMATSAIGESDPDSDVERLQRATGGIDEISTMRPYALVEPLAPYIAAERAGIDIDLATLDRAAAALAAGRDLLLIESAGGVLVPITRTVSFLDLFRRWDAEIIVVAGNRLGAINHTLLTVGAIERAGLVVSAIVLTDLARPDDSIARATNFNALRALLPHHALFRFPWLDRVDDLGALAAAAADAGLDALLHRTVPR